MNLMNMITDKRVTLAHIDVPILSGWLFIPVLYRESLLK
ncbi:hypothetical protein CHCC20490_1270 [Bacillus paralicheniformis]|nr:hypothetical protein CHCC5027_3598 [Bacillus paralicheniformis]TWN88520.1 hypothetical protein CHCC20490_1270 [Bacillus paralicheniformis]